MKVQVEGQVINAMKKNFEGKEYEFFELLQITPEKSEVITVSGNGVKVGEKVKFDARVYVSDRGKLKVKKIEEVKTK